jgi:hypothetical protein
MPNFRIFGSKNAEKSLRWPSNALVFYALINYNILYTCKTIQACFDGNQQKPPFPKLHIELVEQFEGSRTLSNPCSQKIELNNPASNHTAAAASFVAAYKSA